MRILFQGDSITDVGRNTERGSLVSVGQGYPCLLTARLTAYNPGWFECINRGISGNRIVDLYARIKCDFWNLEPDLCSILLGVNDVWHEFGGKNGVDAKRFYNVYKMLVDDTLERFPKMKFILMEPFCLKGPATQGVWDDFRRETDLRGEAVRRIAEETKQTFLPLQKMLDDACEKAPATHWLGDGVHPTPAGHQLIADAWMEIAKPLLF